MKNKLIYVLSLIIINLTIACQSSNGQTDLSINDFTEKIKKSPKAQLLDVRTPEEWAQGKIASSVGINYNDPAFKANLSKLDKTKPVFVYCAVGGRSAKASQILKEAGFKEIYNLKGAGYSQVAAAGIK